MLVETLRAVAPWRVRFRVAGGRAWFGMAAVREETLGGKGECVRSGSCLAATEPHVELLSSINCLLLFPCVDT